MERRNLLMIRRITILVTALLVALTMSIGAAGAVFAAPPLPDGCFKERGTIYCIEEGKNPKFSEETSKKGSFQSSHPAQEDCNRPGQTEKCPPGQF